MKDHQRSNEQMCAPQTYTKRLSYIFRTPQKQWLLTIENLKGLIVHEGDLKFKDLCARKRLLQCLTHAHNSAHYPIHNHTHTHTQGERESHPLMLSIVIVYVLLGYLCQLSYLYVPYVQILYAKLLLIAGCTPQNMSIML